jgi:hypothetical protein
MAQSGRHSSRQPARNARGFAVNCQLVNSYEIRFGEKGSGLKPVRNRRAGDDGPAAGTRVGEVEASRGPHGLVPGGKYLHIGTHIYTRDGLKPVSAANPAGHAIELMLFSREGERYALVTSEYESRPSPLGLGFRCHIAAQRLRVHDTRSGKTLFSVSPSATVRHLAFSPDGTHLATVNERQEVELWPWGMAAELSERD